MKLLATKILVLAALALIPLSGAHAQISADFYLGGAILVGESTSTCDGSIAGAIRYNADDNVLELCHDDEWTAIDGGGGGCTANEQTLTYTGSNQTYEVPQGCENLIVKLWGAGGGQGYSGSEKGGGGAFVQTLIEATPGETLTIIVGEGGKAGDQTSTYGGGGGAGVSSYLGGSGGGRSAIRRSSTELATAAGGGGGGASSCGNAGGGGGGPNGQTGTGNGTVGSNGAGGGATQSAGGSGGSGNTGTGQSGSQYQGGRAATGGSTYSGGGGGGGYYGGGGGGSNGGSTCNDVRGGGGGGSSYTAGSVTMYEGATWETPGGAGDDDYATGIGKGGGSGSGSAGGNGLVIITPRQDG